MFKNNLYLLLKQTSCGNTNFLYRRNLYSASTLGIDGFAATRDKIKAQFMDSTDSFKDKMKDFLTESSKNMIFTEDLKNMIHLAEKNKEDKELVVNMMKKFNSQNKELRFGNYVFGPVAMRMFYYLKDEKMALECFKDESLTGFFDQLMSYQVLLDMLYETKRYQDVMSTFDMIKSRQVQGGKYPKHVIVIVFAAAYKENTPQSFEYAMSLWKELNVVGHIPMRKAAAFAATLALKNNSPHIALEIAGTIKQQNYVTVRNIKCAALSDLGRIEDVIPILRGVLEITDPLAKKHTFCTDVLETLNAAIKKSGKPAPSDLPRILKFLHDNNHIGPETLDELLCQEITSTAQSNINRDQRVLAASFSTRGDRFQYENRNRFDNRQGRYNRNNRPGLEDLY